MLRTRSLRTLLLLAAVSVLLGCAPRIKSDWSQANVTTPTNSPNPPANTTALTYRTVPANTTSAGAYLHEQPGVDPSTFTETERLRAAVARLKQDVARMREEIARLERQKSQAANEAVTPSPRQGSPEE